MKLEDIWDHMTKMLPGGCLEWNEGCDRYGYGRARIDGRTVKVYRAAWEAWNDQRVPKGRCVMHLCDNPPCCEPTHLRLGTQAENVADMDRKGRRVNSCSAKTHCPQGHPYDEVNTYVTPSGTRQCWTCKRKTQGRGYRAPIA
jgi:hypothetical protein